MSYYDELRQQREDVARIGQMIDDLRRAEIALREAYDERRCLGGGSRTRIGGLLGIAEGACRATVREIEHLGLDYPVREEILDVSRRRA